MEDRLSNSFAFEAWLRRKRDGEIVGKALHGGGCPVAMFLKEECKAPSPLVLTSAHVHDSKRMSSIYKTNPPWVKKFVRLVDTAPVPGTRLIKKELALEFLRMATERPPKKEG